MSRPAVQIDRLCKCYRLGEQRGMRYRTLRESVYHAVAAPWRRLRGRSQGEAEQTLWALRDVDFDVPPGEVVGIVGRNGAGKSTLLKILSRITEPTSGEAVLRGRVGSLLEVGTGFHPELTGRENIFLNGAILGMTRHEIARKFDDIVAFSEGAQLLDTPVKRYSSGMCVRLAFAVAAHLETEILIIDEVLAVGDMEFQKKCLGKIDRLARSGRTVLFVSHNLAVVQNLCQRAVLLSGGRVEHVGEVGDVLRLYLGSGILDGGEETSLAPYRAPGSLDIIRRVRLCDGEGRPARHFPAGGGLTIEIAYDSPLPLRNPVLSVLAESLMGERLFYLQTLSQYGALAELPPRGTAVCRVAELPLMPGSYKLSFYCSDRHHGKLDTLERAATLSVVAGDFFGTGSLPPPPLGRFLVRGQWEFPEADGPDDRAGGRLGGSVRPG